MAMCWECEAETDHPVMQSFPSGSRSESMLVLCQSCYRNHYLLLAAELAVESVRTGATRAAGRESTG
jgi:hypothetical protein